MRPIINTTAASVSVLYWRFIDRHADFFHSNPRMAVMAGMRDKMGRS